MHSIEYALKTQRWINKNRLDQSQIRAKTVAADCHISV
jgi:hypothetical protein